MCESCTSSLVHTHIYNRLKKILSRCIYFFLSLVHIYIYYLHYKCSVRSEKQSSNHRLVFNRIQTAGGVYHQTSNLAQVGTSNGNVQLLTYIYIYMIIYVMCILLISMHTIICCLKTHKQTFK
jgi:hypothetical protein